MLVGVRCCGGWQMRQQGAPATRVCVRLRAECGGWEKWFDSVCECLCEWSQGRVVRDAKGLTGSLSPDHLQKGLQHLVPVNCRPTGLSTVKSKSRWPYFYFAFLLDRTAVYCTSAANNPLLSYRFSWGCLYHLLLYKTTDSRSRMTMYPTGPTYPLNKSSIDVRRPDQLVL